MATMEGTFTERIVQASESELAQLRLLRDALASRDPERIRNASWPDSAYRAILLAVEFLSRSQAVSIEPYSEYLTTQRVADLLKVSRPTAIELIDRGELGRPVEKTAGGHRRIRLSEVIAYRQRQRDGWTDVHLGGASDEVQAHVEQGA